MDCRFFKNDKNILKTYFESNKFDLLYAFVFLFLTLYILEQAVGDRYPNDDDSIADYSEDSILAKKYCEITGGVKKSINNIEEFIIL